MKHLLKKNTHQIKGTGTILFVDDEPSIRMVTQFMLQNLGYNVITAVNGQKALEIYQNDPKKIDLVILDLVMPVMNGKECFFALKKFDPNVPIIVSSGYCREKALREMRSNGLNDFISKPYGVSELSTLIFRNLEKTPRAEEKSI